jgi:hypothetical protein
LSTVCQASTLGRSRRPTALSSSSRGWRSAAPPATPSSCSPPSPTRSLPQHSPLTARHGLHTSFSSRLQNTGLLLHPPQHTVMTLMQGLAIYGNGFCSKFEAAACPNALLDAITLVDTPGVLSGEKQRIERTYDFIDVCGWFAARCDLVNFSASLRSSGVLRPTWPPSSGRRLPHRSAFRLTSCPGLLAPQILLMFDPHKLDISDEFKQVISTLKGHDDKVGGGQSAAGCTGQHSSAIHGRHTC